jgi:rare lipoprotein A
MSAGTARTIAVRKIAVNLRARQRSRMRLPTRPRAGEQFRSQGSTAAHRTLPFGTRLRVTNLVTGKSVTVRVNDRGPFVQGRVVDVSPAAAAEQLGIRSGLAKVKVDVVQ